MKVKSVKLKRIIVFLLIFSITVIRPGEFLQRKSYAAVNGVVYSKSLLASMFLASIGVNYVLVNSGSEALQDFLDDKITQFEVIDGGQLPGGDDNRGDWKSTLEGILLSAGAVDILNRFASWLLGNQGDEEIEEVVTGGNYFLLKNGFTVYNTSVEMGNYNTPVINNDIVNSIWNDIGDKSYTYTDYLSILNGQNKYIYKSDRAYILCDSRGLSITANSPTGSMTVTINTTTNGGTKGILFFQDSNNYLGVLVKYFNDKSQSAKVYGVNANGDLLDIEEINSGGSIYQVTEQLEEPVIPLGGGMVINQPKYINTYNYNSYNVPVPVSDYALTEQIMSDISENSDSDIVYNPTYTIINNYADENDIASPGYDIPVSPDDVPEAQPSSGVAEELINDLWNYFSGVFAWDQIKVKFPFSIPYDIYLIASGITGFEYSVMDGLPEGESGYDESNVPVYTIPLPMPDGTAYNLILDFGSMQPIMGVVRAGTGVLFLVALLGVL